MSFKATFVAAVTAITTALAVPARADDTVRYATDGFGLGGLIVLAAEKGYFKEEGIDAILQTYAYGVDTVDAVLAGQADFGVIIDMPSMARLKTGKLTAEAVIGIPRPGFHKLFVRSDLALPEGLKGKVVASATGTSQEFITRSWLQTLGLDADKDVQLTGFADLFSIVGAMKAGRVDAAWLWMDGVETMKTDDRYTLVTDDSIVNQDTATLLLAAKDFADAHPDLVVKTLRALDKAAGDVNGDLDAAAGVVARKLGADAGKVSNAFANNRFGLSFGAGPMSSYKAKYDFLVGAGKLEPFDIFATFDSKALAEAVPGAEIDPMVGK